MPYSIRKHGRKYCLVLKKTGKNLGCHDTKEGAEAQRRAIEMNKHASRHLILRGAANMGLMRTAEFESKPHVVVPVVALVEGVIWPINAPHPEFVPADTFSMVPQGWNGRPVFASIGHPVNDAGEQVTGNSPRTLETAIGTVFNTRIEGKKLVMEAWIDPSKPGAQDLLDRVNSGKTVEVSVGAFVICEDTGGSYGGKQYEAIWRDIIPDHLALLPEGDEGACSVAMGCGIRAASVHEMEAPVKTEEKMTELLTAALKKLDPLKTVLVFGDGVCVYEAMSGKVFRQDYTENNDSEGSIRFASERIEVEPRMYYEPVEPTVAKGARHSQADMARIQAMHDHTMELGAKCSSPAPMAAADHKEKPMARTKEQREELVKSLRSKVCAKCVARLDALAKKSGGSDLIDAIISGIKEKLGLSDAAAADLANLEESTLVELAGMAAPPAPDEADPNAADPKEGKTPPDPNAPPTTSAAAPKTEAEWLAAMPENLRSDITAQRAAQAAKKDGLITTLKAAQKEYSEADLKAMSVSELERLVRVCGTKRQGVDFGVNVPGSAGDEQNGAAPAPINIQERLANRNKKQ